ncbi:MAG: YesL family protein [Clostridium sp.]|nr:YesL family protein [Clostridium sp.]
MGSEKRRNVLNVATKILYELITNNAIFLAFNIHIFIFLFLFRWPDIVSFYISMGILSINVLPSYVALRYSLENLKESDENIFKRFIKGYKENFKRSFVIGIIGILAIVISLLDGVYFSLIEQETLFYVFQIIFFIFLVFFISASTILLRFDFNIKETLKVTLGYYFKLLFSSLVTIFILGISLYLSRFNMLPLIVGFSIAGYVQNSFNYNIIKDIRKDLITEEE